MGQKPKPRKQVGGAGAETCGPQDPSPGSPWEQPKGHFNLAARKLAALCPDTNGGGKTQRLEPVS